jgi:hypothetical protein
MTNNYFLLIRDLVGLRRAVMADVETQLKAEEGYEPRQFGFDIADAFDLAHAPIDQMAWRGVRRLPWLERLLDFDKVEALFITGPLKVVVSQYCFRTALPVNHGSALRASMVESRLVSDMRKSATQLPAIVNMRKHDRTIPLALDHVRFWQLPFDKQSFNNDPHCVAAALNLELIVIVALKKRAD